MKNRPIIVGLLVSVLLVVAAWWMHGTALSTASDEQALAALDQAIRFLPAIQADLPLTLQVGYDHVKEDYFSVESNAMRELIYNIEHAVHHMAIIKIGVREVAPYVTLPHDFGIAASTLRFNHTHQVAAQI